MNKYSNNGQCLHSAGSMNHQKQHDYSSTKRPLSSPELRDCGTLTADSPLTKLNVRNNLAKSHWQLI